MKLLISEGADSTVAPISAGRFDPKEAQAYAKQINREIYQQDVVALQNLSHIQNISMNAQDMQLMEQLNMGLDDVARFYATPRPLLMLDTNSHYNDYTNATMEYLQRTIAPDAVEIENECNRKLLSVYDFGRRRFHLCERRHRVRHHQPGRTGQSETARRGRWRQADHSGTATAYTAKGGQGNRMKLV